MSRSKRRRTETCQERDIWLTFSNEIESEEEDLFDNDEDIDRVEEDVVETVEHDTDSEQDIVLEDDKIPEDQTN